MEKKVIKILEKYPDLNPSGMGLFYVGHLSKSDQMDKLYDGRKAIIRRSEIVKSIVLWLDQFIVPTKTINKKRTSYNMKHIVEYYIGYISNGEFIVAALLAGFKPQFLNSDPNVQFAMSEKSWKLAEDLLRKPTNNATLKDQRHS